jgi:hypothetical protein
MNLFSRKNNRSFKRAVLRESGEDIPNPGRGWYQLFSMDAAAGAPLSEWQYAFGEGGTLALLQVDISSFAGGALSAEALSNIRRAFLFFQKEQKELLLRFAYDRKGHGMETEPADIRVILGHIRQLAPLLAEFRECIFCIQGLFVGSWGEMHDSRFLTDKALGTLWQQVYRLFPETCFFAVRRPAQWLAVAGRAADSPEGELRTLRLGLFNDGLLGSATDLGTFPEEEREKNIEFQKKLCCFVPNGGEAVGTGIYGETEHAVDYFRSIHISYLNSMYDEQVLNRWKNSTYRGENGYAYIGRHLGYRFVVTDARLIGRGMQQSIRIELENRGFAPIYEECGICLCSAERNVEADGQMDLRKLLPGNRMAVQFTLAGLGSGALSVFLYRRKDHRCIRLANEGAGEKFVVGSMSNAG